MALELTVCAHPREAVQGDGELYPESGHGFMWHLVWIGVLVGKVALPLSAFTRSPISPLPRSAQPSQTATLRSVFGLPHTLPSVLSAARLS